MKKTLALVGSLLILSATLIFAADNSPAKAQKSAQKKVTTRSQPRTLFVDQDGDGICDFARDHDNDGIPNYQDPDWSRPQDGTGYQERNGRNNSNQYGNRHGYNQRNSWQNHTSRQSRALLRNNFCDGTGPHGNFNRNGRN